MNRYSLQARLHRHWAIVCVAALITLLLLARSSVQAGNEAALAKTTLRDTTGKVVGKVLFMQKKGEVAVMVEINNLPAGFHGFHIHSVGECTPPFTTAGSHFTPNGHTHPSHAADLPVLLVQADGTGEAIFTTDRFSVRDLFDADGSAVIVHANPDNYANIPTRYASAPDTTTLETGDAGPRIACGVIQR